jgi:hypothetical protein
MRPRDDGRLGPLNVQALYSTAALARAANVTSKLMRRLLRANGVTLIRSGRALFVPLFEISRKIPPLWESLLLLEEVRTQAAKHGSRVSRERTGHQGRPVPGRTRTP